jgi:hypothetical protein
MGQSNLAEYEARGSLIEFLLFSLVFEFMCFDVLRCMISDAFHSILCPSTIVTIQNIDDLKVERTDLL